MTVKARSLQDLQPLRKALADAAAREAERLRERQEAARRARLGKLYYRPPGGESWADVALRLRSFLSELRDVRHRYQQDFVDQCAQWLGAFANDGDVPVAGRWAILGAAESLSEAVAAGALRQPDAEAELQRLIVDTVNRAR